MQILQVFIRCGLLGRDFGIVSRTNGFVGHARAIDRGADGMATKSCMRCREQFTTCHVHIFLVSTLGVAAEVGRLMTQIECAN